MTTSGVQAVTSREGRGLVAVDGRTYPLKSAAIRARAGAGVAAATLLQEFENPHAEPLEAIYTMPLPADGAVLGYRIRIGERTITGEIEVREEATKRYREALASGRTAGLLEQERADTFTQSIGNVPAGVGVRVEIDLVQPLGFVRAEGAGPEWEWRFPTVVGVRYLGAAGRVPDAAALDPERAGTAGAAGTPARVSLELTLTDGEAAALAPRSPSHALVVGAQAEAGEASVEAASDGAASGGAASDGAARDDSASDGAASDGAATKIAFDAGAALDRDVVVRWSAALPATGVTLVEGPGLPGDDGRYALLTLTPPAAPGAVLARALTILVDASGSMSGRPIDQAKALTLALLDGLVPRDRFEILAFASQPVRLTEGLVDATRDAVAGAQAKVAALQAGGGTEMLDALEAALAPQRAGEQRQVVLITDGEIGFESELVAKVLRDLPAASRVHVVGIGSAPNRTLTRGLSRAGRGLELLIPLADDPAAAAARLRAATEAPVLVGLRVSGSALAGVAPERACDLYAGRPLALCLELKPEGGTLELAGTPAEPGPEWRWSAAVPACERAARAAPAGAARALPAGALYGRERIEDLEMHLAAASQGNGAGRQVLDRIEAAALRHRVVSRRTSFVAISEEPTVDPKAPRRRVKLAVEMPQDVSAEGVGFGRAAAAGALFGRAMPFQPRMQRVFERVEDTLAALEVPQFLKQHVDRAEPPTFDQRIAPFDRPPVVIVARVLQLDGERIVLEFEVPAGGSVEMPRVDRPIAIGEAPDPQAILGSGEHAEILEPDSTRPGRYDAGLTLRLALRGVDWQARCHGRPLFAAWESGGAPIVLVIEIE